MNLSLEELANIRVTTVSRVEEGIRDAAASVFVITADEIRRSGVTSIPEALRLAPGVEVARRGANGWSISIRGFNSDLSNKLLVLIDGRSVYSPLYAGVFWDVQDTLLEDIDRIEVISGPGGTLWGANAVNGVINIITRSALDTQGGLAEMSVGNEDKGAVGLRYGGSIGDNIRARVFVKALDRDASETVTGADSVDGMRMMRGGFRMDWALDGPNQFTLQGDVYSGHEDGQFSEDFSLGTLPSGTFRDQVDLGGANLLGRWNRRLTDQADLQLQVYYDHTRRDIPNTYGEKRDTVDIDFQHHLNAGTRQDIVWGAGYRETSDQLDNSTFASFEPQARTDRTLSVFVQDQIELRPDSVYLSFGSKFENNDYTGTEVQPNVRLSWRINERQVFWSAVSRAVRIPSRLDADLKLTAPVSIPGLPFPVYVEVNGSREFSAEEVLSREIGFRFELAESLSFDFATFYNTYEGIQTTEPRDPILALDPPLPYVVLPNVLDNGMEGTSSGGTVATVWQPTPSFQTRFQYSRLNMSLRNQTGSLGSATSGAVGNSPENQFGIYSFLDLPHDLSLYVGVRYVDDLPAQSVDAYTAVDMSLLWTVSDRMRASLTIHSINDSRHTEFSQGGGNVLRSDALLRITRSF